MNMQLEEKKESCRWHCGMVTMSAGMTGESLIINRQAGKNTTPTVYVLCVDACFVDFFLF